MRAGGKHPSDLHALKKPSPYRVNIGIRRIANFVKVDSMPKKILVKISLKI